MAGFSQTSGKYSVLVTGGNANVGYKARMNFYGGQRRGYSTRQSTRATTRITGPGQILKDVPPSVLSEVVMYLNNPSPLGNNWKAVAAELSLSFPTIQSLDYHGDGGMMDGVMEIMFQKKMTVQDLADIMEKIQRPDIIEILVKAGLPERNIRPDGNTNDNGNLDGLRSSNDLKDVTIATPDITSQTTSTTNSVKDCKQPNCLKQYKQLARDLPETQSKIEDTKITHACAHEIPSSVDKLPDVQGFHDNAVICEELAGVTQRGGLKCSVISIESSDGESNEDVIKDDRSGSSIIDRIARFIFDVYSGFCGRLRFREN
ncbi:uncharacterized protein LOC144659920 isoform X2 [Oculina patagonica]